MSTLLSKDGTSIAYDKTGSGPGLVLVDGALCHRKFGPMKDLAPLLAQHFTVVSFDRRGRGASGAGTSAWSIEREIEDIAALVDVVGGTAFLYGTSSGAVLAARAVAAGVQAQKLALHEPPLMLDGTHSPDPADFVARIEGLVSAGHNKEAAQLFLKIVGVPAFGVFMMGLIPGVMKNMKAGAATLPHDFGILGDTQRGGPLPDELKSTLQRITVPTLTMIGTKSAPYMHHAVKRVQETLPHAVPTAVMQGQGHNIAASAAAPALIAFFQA